MNLDFQNPQNRFSNRVKDYINSRPSYPDEVIKLLQSETGLLPIDKVADIGSGTGKFSELLLKNNNTVYCVEPNKEMREAAEKLLNAYPNFISIIGSAENTGLSDKCVKFITCAQAFHWFDRDKLKRELKRILQPEGWVVLIWNSRDVDSTEFMKEYENFLLRFSIDYSSVNHKKVDDRVLGGFFDNYKMKIFPYSQTFDYQGLKSRLLSSSYAPREDHPKYNEMITRLKEIFNKYKKDNKVDFIYNTEVYYGKI